MSNSRLPFGSSAEPTLYQIEFAIAGIRLFSSTIISNPFSKIYCCGLNSAKADLEKKIIIKNKKNLILRQIRK